MAVGPRAERIGNLPAGGEQNSAQPGPDVPRQVASTKRQAEAAANQVYKADSFGRPADGTGGRGSIWEWDSGLAINDVEGGGSG